MAILFIAVFLPYTIYILYILASTANDPYDWDSIHGPNWNVIIKVPTQGGVRFDIWAEIATGYILFLLFGTGTDAHNTYKRMLYAFGLGKVFPSLYVLYESGSSTPSSVTFARGFASSCASKAKTFFSKSGSVAKTLPGNTRDDSICLGKPTTDCSRHLTNISTNEPILPQDVHITDQPSNISSFFSRIFNRRNTQEPVLPIFTTRSVEQVSAFEMSFVDTVPSGVYARAWASESSAADRRHSEDGVQVVHEVHQAHYKDSRTEKQADASG
jgi:pheromone a factor receptor